MLQLQSGLTQYNLRKFIYLHLCTFKQSIKQGLNNIYICLRAPIITNILTHTHTHTQLYTYIICVCLCVCA